MSVLYSWLLINILLGVYYNIMIHRSENWYDILLFPLIAREIIEDESLSAYRYLIYAIIILFSLPYIIVHYLFLILWTVIVLIIDSIVDK